MTATLLIVQSKSFGQLALWTRVPENSCKPGISGHFQELVDGVLAV